jgi:hypothetical protein
MSNTNIPTIEKALAMYKESGSPSQDILVKILNQIPEIKEKTQEDRRAIRSPYIWLAVSQMAALVAVVIIFTVPSTEDMLQTLHTNDPFYTIDAQVEQFERGINEEDYAHMLVDYTL